MNTYTIQITSDNPPPIMLGQPLFGGHITALSCDSKDTVTASELAKEYGLSQKTVTDKLRTINIGTNGKHIYQREQARTLLTNPSRKRGRKRSN